MEQRAIPDDLQIHSGVSAAGYESLARVSGDGGFSLSVLVDGVHCAGCIQKIESTLAREQDISDVRLNFSTRSLVMSWKGSPARADDYVRTIEDLGYHVRPYDPQSEKDETKKQERFLLLSLGVAGFAMGNIMLISVGLWTSTAETMGSATRDLMHWLSALIALPTILFSGRPFFYSAFSALRAGRTNMDVPISVGLILASGMSLFETINHGEHAYFDSAVMLMFFLLIGRYLDFRARRQARSAATDLLGTLGGFALVIENGRPRRIAVRELRPGMILRVVVGEKFPADGVLAEGKTEVDTALVTGETVPQELPEGSRVYAGTINLAAPVSVRVTKAADDTLLAEIIRLMEKAGQAQAKYVRLADKVAKLYTPVVHVLAAVAFCGWYFGAGLAWQDALMIAVTVLIITCPCALALAVPVVQVLATGQLMRKGILVKSGDALERLAEIDTVLLDKTGTLTIGHPEIEGDYDREDMQAAASLAVHSHHPLSVALAASYDGPFLQASDIREHPGQGLEGKIGGNTVKIGSRAWCGDPSAPASQSPELWLRVEGGAPVRFSFSDRLRADSPETVKKLKDSGLDVVMLSGDRASVAKKIAAQAGIESVEAEKTPPEKFRVLESIREQGRRVLMVGDGLNDAPVLAGADVSMAPGTAIDLSRNAADIVFMGDRLAPVYQTFQTAIATRKLVRQNFTLAVLYNIVAIPLAMAGMITPLIAALAMSGSSLLVIANSFRLRFLK